MVSRWQWLAGQLVRKLWFRAALLSVLGIVTALLATVAAPFIPLELSASIGADAVDNILNILASSMLAVTSFSLTTMVSAYGSATSNVTPRATRLLLEDTTSQNALSTFIGSFLFALVGIIALGTGAYGDQGRVVMLIATIGVIVLIVVTLIRWIDHLSRLGHVGDTTGRVERAAARALTQRMENPCLGGRPLQDPDRDIPAAARPIGSDTVGYVQHVDVEALSKCAEQHGGEVFVTAVPGTLVDRLRPLGWVTGMNNDVDDAVRSAFTLDAQRTFEQDPRFGLSVLSEIASRALSPAMNDAGTAIDVIGRAVRLLSSWRGESDAGKEVPCPRVHVPALCVGDLFDDMFLAIARDGAGTLEVQIRLQKALRTLADLGDDFAVHAARHARRAAALAEEALHLEEDRDAVCAIAAETIAAGGRVQVSAGTPP